MGTLLLSNKLVFAQQNCAGIQCLSSYSNLARLNTETDTLVAKLKKDTITAKDLPAQLRQLEALNEAYLISAGISYQAATTTLTWKNTPILYLKYQLQGNSHGDFMAKTIAEMKAPVVLDPLYQFNYQYFGHFIDKKIFIGPHVFKLSLLGVTTTLQHEQVHSLESEKIREGKMTLARLELTNSPGRRSVNYGSYFRVDEIETHLMDYTLLTDSEFVSQRESDATAQGFPANNLESVRQYRATIITNKAQNLKRFTAESQEMFAKIKARLIHGSTPVTTKYDPTTGAILVVLATEYQSYEFLTFNLQGLIVPADLLDWVKVREILLNVLNWSQQHVQQVQVGLSSDTRL